MPLNNMWEREKNPILNKCLPAIPEPTILLLKLKLIQSVDMSNETKLASYTDSEIYTVLKSEEWINLRNEVIIPMHEGWKWW